MAKRRKKSDDPNVVIVAIVMIVGLVFSYQEKQWNLFWLFALLLLVLALIGAITLLVRLRRNDKLRRSGIEQIDKMSGLDFEKYIRLLLIDKGYSKVRLTGYYDLGIDVIAEKDNEVWGIQVKRYSKSVGLDAVRQVTAALQHYKCTRAMVITNSDFTRNAWTIANSMNCVLVDRPALIDLILEEKAAN